MTDTNLERAARLDTATISDAVDRHGIVGQCYGIKPCADEFKMCGRAWTLMYGPAASPPGTVGDYIDDIPVDCVIVLANGGRDDVTVWGDILTEVAHLRGVQGTLIDGVNRDVALCRSLGYPIYSRSSWMRTGKDRVQVVNTQTPVSIGNVRVCPGDIVRGDSDGVVVVPREHEEAILNAAESIQEAEDAIRTAVRTGLTLREAREKHRYHSLQSRKVISP
ncbi:RraA family protein [Paraburkholderia sp. BCC1885]|uniref:RraA family protein n=1 Tax=Paraburkholderia sp. BCC1885 TaxID=2562669 RepID=UPI0011821BFD|nr:RraA family protein [Paraburkholderia sp. BCC1885]